MTVSMEMQPHLGSLYGTPSGMQSPGPHQSNFYGLGFSSSGIIFKLMSMETVRMAKSRPIKNQLERSHFPQDYLAI